MYMYFKSINTLKKQAERGGYYIMDLATLEDDIMMLSGEDIYGYPGDIFLWYAWVKIINKEQGLLDTIKLSCINWSNNTQYSYVNLGDIDRYISA